MAEKEISRRTLLTLTVGGAAAFAVGYTASYVDGKKDSQAYMEASKEVEESGDYPQPTKEALDTAEKISQSLSKELSGLRSLKNALKNQRPDEVCQVIQTLDQQNRREQAVNKSHQEKTGKYWPYRLFGETALWMGGIAVGGFAGSRLWEERKKRAESQGQSHTTPSNTGK
jgi:hypothetical protein